MTNTEFTHFDESSRPLMVDISQKEDTDREAVATAVVEMALTTKEKIVNMHIHKGDVLRIAELAGIMGAKRTSDLIPLCHPLPVTKVQVNCQWMGDEADKAYLKITSTVRVTYRTGVEMEALTACSVAALTVYDMCKSVDKGMVIRDIRLINKIGGKSGPFYADVE